MIMTSQKDKRRWALRKKRSHLNHKRKIRSKFVSRIIADTNVWYQLGSDELLFDRVNSKLVPVYNNLWEMSTTGMLHDKVKILKVRNGIRKMMLCQERMILLEPLRYLIALGNKGYATRIRAYTIDMLKFTQKIAYGYYIDDSQQENFRCALIKIKADLYKIQDVFNEAATLCKQKNKNFKKHRAQTNYMLMVGLLDYMAKMATQGDFDLKRVPLHDYELLVLVMDCFFKKLETGELKWQRNDLFDLFNLAYVRRGDKYWTNEKRWIQIIKAAGCEEYLYDAD